MVLVERTKAIRGQENQDINDAPYRHGSSEGQIV